MVRDQYQGQEAVWRSDQRIFRAAASPEWVVATNRDGWILENRELGVAIRYGSTPRLMRGMLTLLFQRGATPDVGTRRQLHRLYPALSRPKQPARKGRLKR